MDEEYLDIDGKLKRYKTFSYKEIESLFLKDNWERIFKDPSYLKKFGITSPPETFLVAGSMSSTPTPEGIIAGLCRLRIDEKDSLKGFPINWEHWNFILKDRKVIMVPDKNEDHWFQDVNGWKNRLNENPPHEK